MDIYRGQAIGEFEKSNDADGQYTTKLKRLSLVLGKIPEDGDWQIIVLRDTGYVAKIPEAALAAKDGRYILGGHNTIMRAANMLDMDAYTEEPEINLRRLRELTEEGACK